MKKKMLEIIFPQAVTFVIKRKWQSKHACRHFAGARILKVCSSLEFDRSMFTWSMTGNNLYQNTVPFGNLALAHLMKATFSLRFKKQKPKN